MALFAGIATLLIAIIGAVASYIDNYYTASIGQWVASDLRVRIYEHLQRLSLDYYDSVKTGTLMSTITSDVSTVQNFASASTLGIVVDLLTIVFMLALMFWLDWDYTLIAIGVMPFLLVFVTRLKTAVKEVTREVRRRHRSQRQQSRQRCSRIHRAARRWRPSAERLNRHFYRRGDR